MAEVNRKLARWREGTDGPILFCREALGIEPTPHQQELLAKLAGFVPDVGKYGTTVRSGQGCGKSAAAAIAVNWFLTVFRDSLVHCTAPTEKQLHVVLWGELDRQIRGSKFLSQFLDWRATRILVRGESPSWSAVAHTARNMEALQGKHRQDMLVVCDEASGIEGQFLQALMGGLTGGHNVALLISNPTSTHGYYYDTHHSKTHLWDVLHFSSRDSPLVPASHIDRMESEYGADSAIVRIRVDGEFPQQSEDSLVSSAWTEAAKARALFAEEGVEWRVGVDPARYGSDSTGIALVCGNDVRKLEKWYGLNTVEVAGRVVALCREYPIAVINVDEIGVGAGVVDMLHEQQSAGVLSVAIQVSGVNVATASDCTAEYPRMRDQLWFELADRFEDGLIAFDRAGCSDEDIDAFLGECLPIQYRFTINGQRQVESKDDMKKKIGRSPDLADAVTLAFCEQTAGVIGFVRLM